MPPDYKVDWQRAALNIRAHRSLQSASKVIGEHSGLLAQFSRGEVAEPKFSQAMKILDLHTDLCGPEMTHQLLKA